jgi:hypothetical protein
MVHGSLRKLTASLPCAAAMVFIWFATAAAQTTQPKGLSTSGIPLLGTKWNLITLFRRSVPLDDREPNFALQERERFANGSTGSLVGEDSVNGVNGNYQTTGHSLRITIVAVGAVAEIVQPNDECGKPPDLSHSLDLENRRSAEGCGPSAQNRKSLVDALNATASYQITDSILELLNPRGEVLARLVAAEPSERAIDSATVSDRTDIEKQIDETENALNAVKSLLNAEEQKTAAQIRTYIIHACKALKYDDLDGARTLSNKAHVLLLGLRSPRQGGIVPM